MELQQRRLVATLAGNLPPEVKLGSRPPLPPEVAMAFRPVEPPQDLVTPELMPLVQQELETLPPEPEETAPEGTLEVAQLIGLDLPQSSSPRSPS